MTTTPNILTKIIQRKQQEIIEHQRVTSLAQMQQQAKLAPSPRGFIRAITERINHQSAAVIAEIKKASPSQGVFTDVFDPSAIAKSYQDNGACCLSVLTDKDFFQGCNEYLKQARAATTIPVIRKDFIIDPYQVYEARAIGADCILLIVAALNDQQLKDLHHLAIQLGMDVLVEVHNRQELERASALSLSLIGINNRDLNTFNTDLNTTLDLLDFVPTESIVITESGIKTREDVALMRNNAVNGFLIGETFMRANDPGYQLAQLFND